MGNQSYGLKECLRMLVLFPPEREGKLRASGLGSLFLLGPRILREL